MVIFTEDARGPPLVALTWVQVSIAVPIKQPVTPVVLESLLTLIVELGGHHGPIQPLIIQLARLTTTPPRIMGVLHINPRLTHQTIPQVHM